MAVRGKQGFKGFISPEGFWGINSSQRLYSLRIATLAITVCLASDVSGCVCLLLLKTEDQDWRLDVLELLRDVLSRCGG